MDQWKSKTEELEQKKAINAKREAWELEQEKWELEQEKWALEQEKWALEREETQKNRSKTFSIMHIGLSYTQGFIKNMRQTTGYTSGTE